MSFGNTKFIMIKSERNFDTSLKTTVWHDSTFSDEKKNSGFFHIDEKKII